MSTPDVARLHHVPELVRRLYSLVAELEELFPGRKFTPDGHLVGSIGEVIAAQRYDLSLLPASSETHDGSAADGRLVEVKTTQGDTVALRAEPQHLIVLHLSREGHATEVFNGPGSLVWSSCGKIQKNGQRPVSLPKLRKLMSQVPSGHRLPARMRPNPSLKLARDNRYCRLGLLPFVHRLRPRLQCLPRGTAYLETSPALTE